jgi:hypothetical protein
MKLRRVIGTTRDIITETVPAVGPVWSVLVSDECSHLVRVTLMQLETVDDDMEESNDTRTTA